MNSDLYPEPAAAGSLAAALERLAADLGVDLEVVPGDWGHSFRRASLRRSLSASRCPFASGP
ncbi:hypothetical protein ACIOG8_17865 [Streptomyces erythrochromogenes]|uniref:hypothetical protein n=1 Tax=Streptomyces erythrochromogenes TaxID=285574 RepID=UPI00381C7A9D